MEMKKLLMCRICLVENVHMNLFANTNLQEMYEKLTDMPLVTKNRPIVACFICYAKLKQCCRFQRKCLQAEELFAQMLNDDCEAIPQPNRSQVDYSEYVIAPTQYINIFDVGQAESNIKEELPDGAEQENEPESEHGYKVIEHVDISPHDSESDLEDDVPLLNLKFEVEEENEELKKEQDVEEEQGVPKKKRKAKNTMRAPGLIKPNPDTRSAEMEDTFSNQKNKPEEFNSKMITNINLQSGVKPYECSICHRICIRNSALIKHYRVHTGEKPYKCEICQRSFSEKGSLTTHMRIHTGEKPFTCGFCQRSFIKKGDLRNHVRTHTGEKPFKCGICDRSFNLRALLNRHIRSHTGEKPYKCDVCERGFSTRQILKNHMRRHKCKGL